MLERAVTFFSGERLAGVVDQMLDHAIVLQLFSSVLKVFPHQILGEREDAQVRLLDMQGRELLRQRLMPGNNALSVGHLARGSVLGEVRDHAGRVLYRSPLLLQ